MGKLVKPTIDKSKLMKEAWERYNDRRKYQSDYTFSEALAWAWSFMKGILVTEIRQYEFQMKEARYWESVREKSTKYPIDHSCSFMDGAADSYSKARRGTYFGD